MTDLDLRSAATDCTAISRAIGEPLLPSVTETPFALLLVEDPRPWPEDAVARSAWLPAGFWPGVWEAHQVRVQLIRRVGRRRRDGGGRVFLVWPGPPQPWIEMFTIDGPDDLAALDLAALEPGVLAAGRRPGWGTPHADPLLLACTHGTVDRCCARYGRKVATALAAEFPDLTWETTHVGGCRFAANLVIAPDLAYHGRLTPEAAIEVVHRHLAGRVSPTHLRGHVGLPAAAEVALAAVRAREGLDAKDAVAVTRVEEVAAGPEVPEEPTRVTVAAGAARHVVTVVERPLATTAYGCGYDDTHDWTEHVVVAHVVMGD